VPQEPGNEAGEVVGVGRQSAPGGQLAADMRANFFRYLPVDGSLNTMLRRRRNHHRWLKPGWFNESIGQPRFQAESIQILLSAVPALAGGVDGLARPAVDAIVEEAFAPGAAEREKGIVVGPLLNDIEVTIGFQEVFQSGGHDPFGFRGAN